MPTHVVHERRGSALLVEGDRPWGLGATYGASLAAGSGKAGSAPGRREQRPYLHDGYYAERIPRAAAWDCRWRHAALRASIRAWSALWATNPFNGRSKGGDEPYSSTLRQRQSLWIDLEGERQRESLIPEGVAVGSGWRTTTRCQNAASGAVGLSGAQRLWPLPVDRS